MKKNIPFLIAVLALFSCARVGSPNGGEKDITPPKVVKSYPDSMAKNVPESLKELRIDFDEYVTLKDAAKQLIVSPPIKQFKKIIPSSIANKYILLQWQDTLQANTTYNFNFGNSIADNNEGNVLPFYNFVFSTGDKIDSLYVTGYVDDILKPRKKDEVTTTKNDKPIIVGLYKSDTKEFNVKPYYISPVDGDGYFELNYLAAGDYKMLAFQDENSNMIYDSGKEKIAFLPKDIQVKKDTTGIRLLLSPPKKKFKLNETKAIPGGLLIDFSGKPLTDSLQLKYVGGEALQSYTISKKEKSDSAYVWINPQGNTFGASSTQLKFSFYNPLKKKTDTTSVYYKPNLKEELTLSSVSGGELAPETEFRLRANMELKNIDTSQWQLTMDSTQVVPFTATISPNNTFEFLVKADFQASKKYSLSIAKESVQAYYFSNAKKTIFNFQTGKIEDYSSLVLQLQNAPKSPYWVQLLSENFEIFTEKKVEGISEVEFKNIKPDTYQVRILVDNNNNGEWDGADFEKHIQPEDAYLLKKKLILRPSWKNVETWDLLHPVSEDTESQNSFIPTGNGIKKIDLKPEKKKEEPKESQNNTNPFMNNNMMNGGGFRNQF